MASSYNTRSRTPLTASASSLTIESRGQTQQSQNPGTTGNITLQPRHFCIALTNNPRMLRKAQQELSFAATRTTISVSEYSFQ